MFKILQKDLIGFEWDLSRECYGVWIIYVYYVNIKEKKELNAFKFLVKNELLMKDLILEKLIIKNSNTLIFKQVAYLKIEE